MRIALMLLGWLIGCAMPAWSQTPSGSPPGAVGEIGRQLSRQAVEVLQRPDLIIESVEWFGRSFEAKESVTVPADVVLIESAVLRVTVKNAGTVRWASPGRVTAVVRLGTVGELDGVPRDETKRAGLQLVQQASSNSALRRLAPRVAPFGGEVQLPGSLAPDERRVVEIRVLGLSGRPDPNQKLLMSVDKYYTARVDLQISGDGDPANNGADLTFLINARGGASDAQFRRRSTDPARRGSVEVRAPSR
jgi:hypothetical protein